MTDFRGKYKRVGLGLDCSSIIRSQKLKESRREKRELNFSRNRMLPENIKNMNEPGDHVEDSSHEGEKIEAARQSRLELLQKWKEEKELRRKIEKEKTKPVFKVGVMHHRAFSPSSTNSSPTKNTKIGNIKQDFEVPVKKISRVTEKKLAIKSGSVSSLVRSNSVNSGSSLVRSKSITSSSKLVHSNSMTSPKQVKLTRNKLKSHNTSFHSSETEPINPKKTQKYTPTPIFGRAPLESKHGSSTQISKQDKSNKKKTPPKNKTEVTTSSNKSGNLPRTNSSPIRKSNVRKKSVSSNTQTKIEVGADNTAKKNNSYLSSQESSDNDEIQKKSNSIKKRPSHNSKKNKTLDRSTNTELNVSVNIEEKISTIIEINENASDQSSARILDTANSLEKTEEYSSLKRKRTTGFGEDFPNFDEENNLSIRNKRRSIAIEKDMSLINSLNISITKSSEAVNFDWEVKTQNPRSTRYSKDAIEDDVKLQSQKKDTNIDTEIEEKHAKNARQEEKVNEKTNKLSPRKRNHSRNDTKNDKIILKNSQRTSEKIGTNIHNKMEKSSPSSARKNDKMVLNISKLNTSKYQDRSMRDYKELSHSSPRKKHNDPHLVKKNSKFNKSMNNFCVSENNISTSLYEEVENFENEGKGNGQLQSRSKRSSKLHKSNLSKNFHEEMLKDNSDQEKPTTESRRLSTCTPKKNTILIKSQSNIPNTIHDALNVDNIDLKSSNKRRSNKVKNKNANLNKSDVDISFHDSSLKEEELNCEKSIHLTRPNRYSVGGRKKNKVLNNSSCLEGSLSADIQLQALKHNKNNKLNEGDLSDLDDSLKGDAIKTSMPNDNFSTSVCRKSFILNNSKMDSSMTFQGKNSDNNNQEAGLVEEPSSSIVLNVDPILDDEQCLQSNNQNENKMDDTLILSNTDKEEESSFYEKRLSTTPENLDKPPAFFSPYIVTSRGKKNVRKEQQIRRGIGNSPNDSIPTKDTIMQQLNISIEEEERTAQYFRFLLNKEIERLTKCCELWDNLKEESDITEDAKYKIVAAVGQTKLLINKKFERFNRLVNDCETGKGEMLVTCKDLQGFWEMMYMEVKNCDDRFRELKEDKARGWVEEEEVIAVPKKVIRKKGPKKPTIEKESSLRAHILAARKKKFAKKEDFDVNIVDTNDKSATLSTEKLSKVSELTPTKVKLARHSTPKSGNRRQSLLQMVQLSETSKNTSPLTMMKVSQMFKDAPEVHLDESIVYINSDQTPAKSILKRKKEYTPSENKSGQLTFKVNFKEKPIEFEIPNENINTEADGETGGSYDQETRIDRRLDFDDDSYDTHTCEETGNSFNSAADMRLLTPIVKLSPLRSLENTINKNAKDSSFVSKIGKLKQKKKEMTPKKSSSITQRLKSFGSLLAPWTNRRSPVCMNYSTTDENDDESINENENEHYVTVSEHLQCQSDEENINPINKQRRSTRRSVKITSEGVTPIRCNKRLSVLERSKSESMNRSENADSTSLSSPTASTRRRSRIYLHK